LHAENRSDVYLVCHEKGAKKIGVKARGKEGGVIDADEIGNCIMSFIAMQLHIRFFVMKPMSLSFCCLIQNLQPDVFLSIAATIMKPRSPQLKSNSARSVTAAAVNA
jgi:hypothetical protein